MSDKIKVKDGTEISTISILSLQSIVVHLDNISKIEELKAYFTDENLSELKVLNTAGNTTGVYSHLALNDVWNIKWTADGIDVTFGFRPKTEIELEIETIKKDMEVSDGAVDALAGAVGELAVAVSAKNEGLNTDGSGGV